MVEYHFTLIIEGDVEANLDALFEAGCDDATFGTVDCVQYADFDRAAPTFLQAVASAIEAVESIPGLRVRRLEPDNWVTASDIAGRLRRSRESVRLLIAGERGPGGFPAPISHLRTRNRLWRWVDVAVWACGHDTQKARDASLVAATNAALELREALANLSVDERAFVHTLECAPC